MDIQYGRKRSGIKRELTAKIDEWIASITDVGLRLLVERDVIVTGGSIASMLIGEKINDFDVYFRTKSTTVEVAKYYVSQFNITHDKDMAVEQRTIKNCKGVAEERVSISIVSDGIAEDERKENTEKYRPVFLSQNAITLSDKIQIVIRFFGSPNEIHNNYDFVHATCWWDHSNKFLNLPAEALEMLLSRTLIYRGSLYPIASIFRMKKFLERGWRITAGQQLKIMWQISELDLKDKNILQEQLTGVDMSYLWQLIQALKNVDSDKIDSTYVATIIDKIFE